MPRGVKRSPQERLAQVEERIAKITEELNEAKAEKTALVNEIEAARLAELQKVIDESGKTPKEIIAILKAQ